MGAKTWVVLLFMLSLLLPITGGCTRRLGDFTLLSTKNINLTNFSTEKAEKCPPVRGVDSRPIVILPGPPPNLKEAVDRALESGNAHMLTNAVIYYRYWYVPYICGEMTFEVKGNAVRR